MDNLRIKGNLGHKNLLFPFMKFLVLYDKANAHRIVVISRLKDFDIDWFEIFLEQERVSKGTKLTLVRQEIWGLIGV